MVIQGHDFGTNQKPTGDFLLVINTNLHSISHHFQVIADYWSNFRFQQGVPIFNTIVWGEPLNSGIQILALKKLEEALYHRETDMDSKNSPLTHLDACKKLVLMTLVSDNSAHMTAVVNCNDVCLSCNI